MIEIIMETRRVTYDDNTRSTNPSTYKYTRLAFIFSCIGFLACKIMNNENVYTCRFAENRGASVSITKRSSQRTVTNETFVRYFLFSFFLSCFLIVRGVIYQGYEIFRTHCLYVRNMNFIRILLNYRIF